MSTDNIPPVPPEPKISVRPNGPYVVHGAIPLVHKTEVVSEFGEPLTWKKEAPLPTEEPYLLCRCGQSCQKPFCDRTHRTSPYDGTETADTGRTAQRQEVFPGSTRLVVKFDPSLCTDAGFCGTHTASRTELAAKTDNTNVRSQVIAMIERCPSGALTYTIEAGEPDIEPDLPRQIAATTEITSEGPIAGPLWVTGGILVERADGQPLEVPNRMTLCNCGRSKNKPLCDGTHRHKD